MKLIVGLGNPGRKYRETKHNVGFICLDAYATKHGLTFTFNKKLQADVVKTTDALLIKPQIYMNLSGIAVRAATDYYGIDREDVLVIYDDIDLPLAKLRLRYQGSDGGHKGMRSVLSSLSVEDIKRVRIGIGKHPDIDTKHQVLTRFHKREVPHVKEAVSATVDLMEAFIEGEAFVQLMNVYNASPNE